MTVDWDTSTLLVRARRVVGGMLHRRGMKRLADSNVAASTVLGGGAWTRQIMGVGFATLVLVACSAGTTTTPAPSPTPVPRTVDIAAVKANFTAECTDPIVVDDSFCEQVDIAGMTSDGTILNVPTTLNAAAKDRAEAVCEQAARVHFDGEGVDLGFEVVGILDKDGGNAAACSVG